MKLNEIKVAKELDQFVLSIKNGRFTKDGSHLKVGSGGLNVSHNALISLEGCPSHIDGNFSCNGNKLTSLKGGPSYVGGIYYCNNNKLTSLEGGPSYVGGDFKCGMNDLISLKNIHKQIKEIDGSADFRSTPIKSHILGLLKIKKLKQVYFNEVRLEKIINKYLPEGNIFDCQEELIDAGLEEYAQL